MQNVVFTFPEQHSLQMAQPVYLCLNRDAWMVPLYRPLMDTSAVTDVDRLKVNICDRLKDISSL